MTETSPLETLATRIVAEFARRSLTLATAESLTGGLIGATLTSVPGASKVYRGGLITYASDVKVALTALDEQWVAEHGVVNETTAVNLAIAARDRCQASYGLGVTGVAGPEPQDDQPVGRVWVAISIDLPGAEDPVLTRRLDLSGDRGSIRDQTTSEALTWLLDLLSPVDDASR